jgi:hypothetical protein
MKLSIFRIVPVMAMAALLTGCQTNIFKSSNSATATLRDVPAVRLSFRYEADIPAPVLPAVADEELNAAVRSDFDSNRQNDLLARTVVSPNKQRVLVAFRREGDPENTYRLDMYAGDGRFLRRVSPDSLAVAFPDSIVWSPDSSGVAFVALTREGGQSLSTLPSNANVSATPAPDANVNSNSEPTPETRTAGTPEPQAPANVLAFRTEQIYLCSSEGTELKPLTQNEGLIYYYLVWSPDGSALAALAARADEWRYLMSLAAQSGEKFSPVGRPRVIEKNGRERALDDAPTKVYPVWSADSAKVAVAYDKPPQIRIYDAVGTAPTQAAIPLRNPLLISSQAFDRAKAAEAGEAVANTDANANSNPLPSTLPDESTLVSYQPIVRLEWSADSLLYFQTGYVREYVNESENRYSSLRWHRLIFSVQGGAAK